MIWNLHLLITRQRLGRQKLRTEPIDMSMTEPSISYSYNILITSNRFRIHWKKWWWISSGEYHKTKIKFLFGQKHEQLKNEINSTQSLPERKEVQKQFNALDKLVWRATSEDKKDYMNVLVRSAEEVATIYNMKDLHDITRKIAAVTARHFLPVKKQGWSVFKGCS